MHNVNTCKNLDLLRHGIQSQMVDVHLQVIHVLDKCYLPTITTITKTQV